MATDCFLHSAVRAGLAIGWLLDRNISQLAIFVKSYVRSHWARRMRNTCRSPTAEGVFRHVAQQQGLPRDDFARFGWILAMDRRNLRELDALKPANYRGNLGLLLDFAPHLGVREVPDPYYGGAQQFEDVLDLVEPACASLLARVRIALDTPQ